MSVQEATVECIEDPAAGTEPGRETPPREPRQVQADLRRIAAELLRLEARLEDLAAEAAAAAAAAPPGDRSRDFWIFLEAILAQLLVDDFGPLRDELRTAAAWQPPAEAEA